jgi:hypothetical protein
VNLVVGFIELALALSARDRSSISFRDSSERPF